MTPTPEQWEHPQFQVLENIETLPGAYMYKDGHLVEHDGTGSTAIILQRVTLRDCKKMGIKVPVIPTS